ncbi:MAG: hypothetical protein QF570_18235 [Myxococcota bacterium]|jgi:hypothetical protein|nr:hypothetical protein [Myxococcota bacterium]
MSKARILAVDGGQFTGREQASAEKFAQHASTALVNALRLRALDDASLFLIPLARDPMDRDVSALLRNLLARVVP